MPLLLFHKLAQKHLNKLYIKKWVEGYIFGDVDRICQIWEDSFA